MGHKADPKGSTAEAGIACLVGGHREPHFRLCGGPYGGNVVLLDGWRAQVKARASG